MDSVKLENEAMQYSSMQCAQVCRLTLKDLERKMTSVYMMINER